MLITTRNIISFFGLCGLAIALSGHVWPGAFVIVAALVGLVLLAAPEEDADDTTPAVEHDHISEIDAAAEEARFEREAKASAKLERLLRGRAVKTFGGTPDIYCPDSETDQAKPGQVSRIGYN